MLKIEVIDEFEAFAELRDDWNLAAASALDPNVFLTWEWLATWWRHFAETHARSRLHVVTLRDDDGLVAAAPMFSTSWGYGPLRAPVLHQISYDAGDYGGILLIRRPDEAVDALLTHLAELLRHDVRSVVLSRLTTDSTFLTTLQAQLAAGDAKLAAAAAPVVDICLFADLHGDYDLQRRQKKHRIRQRLQRLADKHDVAFEHHTGPTLDEGLERFVTLHQRRWDATTQPMQGLLVDGAKEAFLLDASRALDARGHLRLLTLTADGHTAAADLDYEFAGRLYMFKTAFDLDFAAYAPGQLLVSHVFEDSLARGIQELDFMRGDHPYKRAWTNSERELVAVTLTRPGLSGQLSAFRTRAARAASRHLEPGTGHRRTTG